MTGLAKICKLYGRMTTRNQHGKAVTWVWDYAKDEAVHEEDMPDGSERWRASENAKWRKLMQDSALK